jgi:hypothetical protein
MGPAQAELAPHHPLYTHGAVIDDDMGGGCLDDMGGGCLDGNHSWLHIL